MPLPNDKDIIAAIQLLNDTYTKNFIKFKNIDDLSDTVQDPMALFVHTVFSGVLDENEWFKLEKIRRMDKAFTNQIGAFHEKILSSVTGWYKPSGGFDLANDDKKIRGWHR